MMTLKERMENLRSIPDYRLIPKLPVILMLDGRSFSKVIKSKFKLPFDNEFIRVMNETAATLCKEVQGAKFAYTQSDEISVFLCDYTTPETSSFMDYRLCKLQSICASIATSYACLEFGFRVQFDCKAWNVPTEDDVIAWFLHRQNDCVRNSKQQAAQTYLSHKQLMGHNTDEQIAMLLEQKGIDWNSYDPGCRYGRLIKKNYKDFGDYQRSVWEAEPMFDLTIEENRQKLKNIWKISN